MITTPNSAEDVQSKPRDSVAPDDAPAGGSLDGCRIAVFGAGVMGLWQARTAMAHGARVTVFDAAAADAWGGRASWYAGGMLAPDCEGEAAEPEVVAMGHASIPLWAQAEPTFAATGTLVVAASRDRGELDRFARLTTGHRWVDGPTIAGLEPDLTGRFTRGLYFPREAHVSTRPALRRLSAEIVSSGAVFRHVEGAGAHDPASATISRQSGDLRALANDDFDWIIDARGVAAAGDIEGLRPVRGEMAVLATSEIVLHRPVRLLHPRFPLYVAPWGDGTYMVGATVIETGDAGPVSARSAMELLNAAYAIHPAFGEAQVLEFGTGLRPAFADNTPRIIHEPWHDLSPGTEPSAMPPAACPPPITRVNGAYRHGFLTAPILAERVAGEIAQAMAGRRGAKPMGRRSVQSK